MNVSIGCHPESLLHNRIWYLAEKKKVIFVVDGHNGTGGQMTSAACIECGAYLKVDHEGLPPKQNKRAPASKLMKVNQQVCKFFWTMEAIHRRRLLTLHGRYTCTIEHHNPGAVINHEDEDEFEDAYEWA